MMFLLLISVYFENNATSFIYYDFDECMQIAQYPKAYLYTQKILNYEGKAFFDFGRLLYEQYNPNKMTAGEHRIPKIIHQIWIGGPVPDVFKKYMKTWQDMHPDWQYILWTDEKVQELFPLYNQEFYDQVDGMGVKSDLLKWEIIYRFGGLYVDVDFECLQPFDVFDVYHFYTAFQPLDAYFVQLGAALYAAVPRHPILKHCIETIKDDWHHKGAPKKSGPAHFSKSFMATAGKDGRYDIAFPAFYFYPLGSTQTELKRSEWTAAGAYAVHHWAKSWMPTAYRRREFRTFDNVRSSQVWND
jgi:hypothetical protein